MAVSAVVAVIGAGAAVYQGETQRIASKRARKNQDRAQREAQGAALSAKRRGERKQREAVRKRPNTAAILAAEQSSSLNPTILTPPRQRLGANSALGNVGKPALGGRR